MRSSSLNEAPPIFFSEKQFFNQTISSKYGIIRAIGICYRWRSTVHICSKCTTTPQLTFSSFLGFLHEVFDLLQHKVKTMSTDELDCGLIIDEMSCDEAIEFCPNNSKYFGTTTMPPSDELATHGLVFMLAGISVRWKQVVAYEFTGNSIPKGHLKAAVDLIISKMESIGLKVHFVTSDCGSSNKIMWQDFNVSTKKSTIMGNLSIVHPSDASRTLEFIPDAVHVFKNAVNGWISNEHLTLPDWYVAQKDLESNIVDREHLKCLVAQEEGHNLELAYKLTAADVDFEHSKTSNVDKMKVANSTKYCNYSVAAALQIVAEQNIRPELRTTAVFLEDLAKWFELMSSRFVESALRPSETQHYHASVEHLKMMIRLISELKVILYHLFTNFLQTLYNKYY